MTLSEVYCLVVLAAGLLQPGAVVRATHHSSEGKLHRPIETESKTPSDYGEGVIERVIQPKKRPDQKGYLIQYSGFIRRKDKPTIKLDNLKFVRSTAAASWRAFLGLVMSDAVPHALLLLTATAVLVRAPSRTQLLLSSVQLDQLRSKGPY